MTDHYVLDINFYNVSKNIY